MNLNSATEPKKSATLKIAGAISGGSLMLIMVDVVRGSSDVANKAAMVKEGNIGLIKNLGRVLFNEYVIPFEISSVLFLSAMVGAVVIGKKGD